MNKANTFGFTTSYGELYQKYGKPSRRHDHYTEAEVVTFGAGGQWVYYSNTGTCFKRALDSFSAEETRLRLMRRHVRFTVKHNMADPSERLCNKYPTHNQEFDSDVVFSSDSMLNNKFEELAKTPKTPYRTDRLRERLAYMGCQWTESESSYEYGSVF